MYKVFIEDLEFYSYHGVSGEEQKVGHRYIASVVFSVEGTADKTDRVEDTVDYGAAADVIQRVAGSKKFETVERLTMEIGEELLRRFASAQDIHLKVAKRLPPMTHIAAEAGVELVVSRKPA